MKTLSRNILLLAALLLHAKAYTQRVENIDSLKRLLHNHRDDTNKVQLLYDLSFSYVAGSYADTALTYAQQALDLAEKLNDEPGIFWSEITLGEALAILGNYPRALECNFRALELSKKLGDTLKLCYGNGGLANCYFYMGDYVTSIMYTREILKIINRDDIYWMWIQLAKTFHGMGESDSSLLYAKKAYETIKSSESVYTKSVVAPLLGNAYAAKAIYDSALFYYRMGIDLSVQSHTQTHLVDNYYGIAAVYRSKGDLDSALWYAQKITGEKIITVYPLGLLKAAQLATDIYQLQNKTDSALKYLQTTIAIKDSLYNRQKTIAAQNLTYKEQEKQKELDAYKQKVRNQLLVYILSGGLLVLLIGTGIWLRNRRRRQIQHIRNSIANDLHDDIGSTLSSISIMSELAKAKSPDASVLLTSIGESTAAMQENMDDIVWAVKPDNDSFENMLQRMNQFAFDILEAKNIEFHFYADASLSASRLSMQQRKNFYFFFKEVINNAAKHSAAGNVTVRILKKEKQAEMTITDDGTGFDTSQSFNGNGMNTLKKRAKELGGYCSIQSRPGEGTVTTLTFKIT